MRVFRYASLTGALLLAIAAIIVLLNITARNPTGRRYSSEPAMTSGTTQGIGTSGERILAKDLNLPRNEDPDQRQCICNNPQYPVAGVAECRVCYAYSQSIANYRRPDFVSPSFIAESKNRQGLLYSDTQTVNQIGDYAIAARALNVPLWVYVRVDTRVDPEFQRIVRDTGGDVIPYFTTPGYVDPWNVVAWRVLAGSGAVIIIMGLWEAGAVAVSRRRTKPKRGTGNGDSASRAEQRADAAVNFKDQMKDRFQRSIDEDDSRDDFE
ncbi:MAG: hypothetical protein AAFV33_02575 [Chloroflexota bacterium]